MNLLNYITPKQEGDGVKRTLDGVVVTPFTQTFNVSENIGLDIMDILNDESKISKFPRFTFPKIEVMTNGEMFINPCKWVVMPTGNYYIKWLIFNKDFTPVHDHHYPATRLPKEGYMMKVIVPVLSENPDEFQIEFVVDYHNIHVEISNSIENISQIQSSTQQTSVQVSTQNGLSIEGYMLGKYPEIDSLISDKKLFFDTYIKDVMDVY